MNRSATPVPYLIACGLMGDPAAPERWRGEQEFIDPVRAVCASSFR